LRGGGQAKSGEALGRGADPGGDRLVETQAQTLRAGLGDLQPGTSSASLSATSLRPLSRAMRKRPAVRACSTRTSRL